MKAPCNACCYGPPVRQIRFRVSQRNNRSVTLPCDCRHIILSGVLRDFIRWGFRYNQLAWVCEWSVWLGFSSDLTIVHLLCRNIERDAAARWLCSEPLSLPDPSHATSQHQLRVFYCFDWETPSVPLKVISMDVVDAIVLFWMLE